MTAVAIEELCAMLNEQLAQGVRDRIELKVVGESGLAVRVAGENCLTSISVWPNGSCDVDLLYASSELGEFRHFEFQSTEAAVAAVLYEITSAVERA